MGSTKWFRSITREFPTPFDSFCTPILVSVICVPSERLRYMELKTNAYFSWANHYNMESIVDGKCAEKSDLGEYDKRFSRTAVVSECVVGSCVAKGRRTDEVCPGLYDHHICMDSFKGANAPGGKPCLVYDFGIREQPHFGTMMAKHFGELMIPKHHQIMPNCAYVWEASPALRLTGLQVVRCMRLTPLLSPLNSSPTTKKLRPSRTITSMGMEQEAEMVLLWCQQYLYVLPIGAIKLFEYNWGQVSIVQNSAYINSSSCGGDQCGVSNLNSKVASCRRLLPLLCALAVPAVLPRLT